MTPDDGAPPRLVDAVETRSFDQMTAALREEAAIADAVGRRLEARVAALAEAASSAAGRLRALEREAERAGTDRAREAGL
ncbi:MAG: hypothetical protein AAFZ09_02420, partial [Pseudomonadota bacterium]